jgi:hypothetical protein
MGSRAAGAVREADFITGEAYTDWTGLEAPSIFSRFLAGVAGDRPFEALVGRFINTWDYTRKTYDQMFFESMTVFSFGGTVTVDDEPYYDGKIDLPVYQSLIAPVFQTIRDWSYTVTGERLRYGAILHSQKTKNSTAEQGEFIRDVVGAYTLLRERHLPVDFVFDETLSAAALSAYRVILLPSVSCMDEKTLSVLKDYVEDGGVVAGFGENAFFEGLFKDNIICEGKSEYSLSYYPLEAETPLVRGSYSRYLPGENMPGKKGKPIIDPIVETAGDCFFHNNLPSPYRESNCPSYFDIPYGKGRILQYNQPISRSYAKQRSFRLRDSVLKTITAYTGAPPFSLEAPSRVDTAVYHDSLEQKIYIHLMAAGYESSLACGILDTMQGNFERPFVAMENRDPVLSVGIKILTVDKINSVASLYEKNIVSWEIKEDTLNIRMDKLGLWDVVEVKYG